MGIEEIRALYRKRFTENPISISQCGTDTEQCGDNRELISGFDGRVTIEACIHEIRNVKSGDRPVHRTVNKEGEE